MPRWHGSTKEAIQCRRGGIEQRGNARQSFEDMMPELRFGKLSRQESDKESTGVGRGILDKGIVS